MNNFTLVNLDTDSISFSKPDGSPFTPEEQTSLLADLNSLFPEKIRFEHDGIYEIVCILAAKNYILKAYVCKKCKKKGLTTCDHEAAKLTLKGSGLKSSKIEPRLKDFMKEVIDCILKYQPEDIIKVYHKYVREIHNLTDIKGFCSKKTVTESVLNPSRTNEEKILDALKGRPVQMGDKIYVYFAEERTTIKVPRYKTDRKTKEKIFLREVEKEVVTKPLRLAEDWDKINPDHSIEKLLERLYNTLSIFDAVIDMSKFEKFHLKGKKTKDKLAEVLNESN